MAYRVGCSGGPNSRVRVRSSNIGVRVIKFRLFFFFTHRVEADYLPECDARERLEGLVVGHGLLATRSLGLVEAFSVGPADLPAPLAEVAKAGGARRVLAGQFGLVTHVQNLLAVRTRALERED